MTVEIPSLCTWLTVTVGCRAGDGCELAARDLRAELFRLGTVDQARTTLMATLQPDMHVRKESPVAGEDRPRKVTSTIRRPTHIRLDVRVGPDASRLTNSCVMREVCRARCSVCAVSG